MVTKSNAQRHGMVLWDEVGAQVGAEFPDVTTDKMLVAVEGQEHFFNACKPEFGDTKRRNFDTVASWLAKAGRF